MQMSTFRLIVAAVFSFAAGTVLMAVFHQDPPPPKPVVQKVTITKEVHGPTRTITKKEVPAACIDYLAAATRTQELIKQYESSVGDLPGLIDDAGEAIFTKDQGELNRLRQQDEQLESDSIKSLMDLNDAKSDMSTANVKCQAALKNQ